MSGTWPGELVFRVPGDTADGNEGWLELSGLQASDPWQDGFEADDAALARAAVRAAASGVDVAPLRLKLAHGGGHVEALARAATEEGAPIRVSIRAVGELPGDQQLYDLVESGPDGVATVQRGRDGQWRIVYTNGRFCELMTMSKQQVIGAECRDILRSEAEVIEAAIDEADATNTPVSLERYRTRAGQRRVIQSTLRPGNERLTGRRQVTLLLQDATHRVDAERQAVDRRLQESLDIMAAGLAHELNNSLLAILGHIELAVDAHGDPSGNLTDARLASVRATHLGKMLLDYTGRGHNVLAAIDVNEVVLGRLSTLTERAGRGITVSTRLRDGIPAVMADARQLGHCLASLVDNSREAMAGTGGEITISTYEREVGAQMAATLGVAPGTYIALAVSDTGPGIAPDAVGRVFEPFYTTRFLGRGLGLASVRGILRAHDGAVLLETAVNVGTTVTLLLPLSPPVD